MTTEHFNKLADALESYTGDGHGYQIDDAVLREAARILRAACAADVGGLMRQAQVFADAYTEWANYPTNRLEAQHDAARAALESALRVAMAPKAGFVMVPVERLTVEEIKTLRQQVRNDPRCQDEHWFVLMARAIEDRYLAAALTDQSQKKESP